MLYRRKLDLLQFLEDMILLLIQEAFSVLTYWIGALCGCVLTELLRTCVSSEFQRFLGHLWKVDLTGLHVG